MTIPNESTFADALITVLIVVLGMLATYLKTHVMPKVKADLGAQQYEILNHIAHTAVLATQQTLGSNVEAHTKLADAVRRAQDLAYEHGFEITDEQMTTLIEQAVLVLKGGKPTSPPSLHTGQLIPTLEEI